LQTEIVFKYLRIYELMSDGVWRTLEEIELGTRRSAVVCISPAQAFKEAALWGQHH